MRLNIHGLIDNTKCYEMIRHLRWAEGVECPHCCEHDVHGYELSAVRGC